jgi:hypothetical protein
MLLVGIVILGWSALFIFRVGAPAAQAAQPKAAQSPPVRVAPGPASSAPSPADMETLRKLAAEVDLKSADLKAQLDYNARNAENLGRLLAFLTFATSLFVIALGANSYFGFRQILQSAKDDLNLAHKGVEDMPKKIDAMKAEIYAAYPLLQNVDAALRELVTTLRDVLPVDVNWREDVRLTEADRQRGLNAELTVAGLEVFQLGRFERYRRSASEIYQGLALFYGNQAVRRTTPGGAVDGDAPEIQRALLYIDKACRTDERNAAAFRDFGALHAVRQDFANAKRGYEASLAIDPEEPGALFGVAYIQASAANPELSEAIERMNALIQKGRWEPGQKKKYLAEAYTNRACYHARLAITLAPADRDAHNLEAMSDLEEGCRAAREHHVLPGWQRRVENERTAGDLAPLDVAFKARIDALLQ